MKTSTFNTNTENEAIALFGKQVSMCKTRTHKSKKVYDRKKFKRLHDFS